MSRNPQPPSAPSLFQGKPKFSNLPFLKFWLESQSPPLEKGATGGLGVRTMQLISTPKIITFLPMLPSGSENSECESNPML